MRGQQKSIPLVLLLLCGLLAWNPPLAQAIYSNDSSSLLIQGKFNTLATLRTAEAPDTNMIPIEAGDFVQHRTTLIVDVKHNLGEYVFCSNDEVQMYVRDIRLTGAAAVQPGDTDGDGDVDLDDLFAVRNNFGVTSGATIADGDVEPTPGGDGDVDLDDLFMVRNNFGTGMMEVPEPVTLSLLCVGGLALLRRRRS